jgi:lysozyme
MPNAFTDNAKQLATTLVKHYETLHDGDLKTIGLQPKLCPAGFWTIGYGQVVIDPVSLRPLTFKTPASVVRKYTVPDEATAAAILGEDLEKYSSHVIALVKVPISDAQIAALTSFAYNVGVGALKNSTLLRLINKSDLKTATPEFLKWDKAKNKLGETITLRGLTFRRMSEKTLFETGKIKFYNV